MKRLLAVILMIPVCVLLALWGWALRLRRTYDAREWPDHLGTIREAPKHFSHDQPNAAGFLLQKMTAAFEKRPKSVNAYVRTQLERTAVEIEPPPAEVAAYLREQNAQLEIIRDHILHAGPIVTFGAQPQLHVTRLLIARVLTTGSWDDLRVAWLLDRQLWDRHEGLFIAFFLTRMLNAAAAKMPLPAPPWLNELRTIDYRHRFAAAEQVDAWTSRASVEDTMRAHPFIAMINGWRTIASDADFSERMRVRTAGMLDMKSCDWRAMGVFGLTDWTVIERYRAELETTEKTLVLRAGQLPPTTSQCSDGTWIVTPHSIRFSHAIPVSKNWLDVPLAHEVK